MELAQGTVLCIAQPCLHVCESYRATRTADKASNRCSASKNFFIQDHMTKLKRSFFFSWCIFEFFYSTFLVPKPRMVYQVYSWSATHAMSVVYDGYMTICKVTSGGSRLWECKKRPLWCYWSPWFCDCHRMSSCCLTTKSSSVNGLVRYQCHLEMRRQQVPTSSAWQLSCLTSP